jgi:hypothetical protein
MSVAHYEMDVPPAAIQREGPDMTRDPIARLLCARPARGARILFVCVTLRLDVAKQFRDAL